MTTTIEEINVKCPECKRNVFESLDNGRCIYCGAVVEDESIASKKKQCDEYSDWGSKCVKVEGHSGKHVAYLDKYGGIYKYFESSVDDDEVIEGVL